MRDTITTAFETAGLLSVDIGIGLAGAQVATPLGFIFGGLMLLGSSLLVVKASGRGATKQ